METNQIPVIINKNKLNQFKLGSSSQFPIKTLVGILFWLLLIMIVVLKLVVFQQVSVVGASMEKNYFNGETLLINQLDRNLNRGQVVAVYRDKEVAKNADYFTRFQATFFLKRIIGLPNEEIEIIGNQVIIYNDQHKNGSFFIEDYISSDVSKAMISSNYYFPKTKILPGNFFLMGDNRTNSLDSRSLGAFAEFAIFGQESVRFWPFDRLTFFSLPDYKYKDLDENLKTKKNELEKRMN